MIVRARFNPCFAQANATRRRYRVLMGGAGSGKSCNVAQDFVLKLMDPKFAGANLLVLQGGGEQPLQHLPGAPLRHPTHLRAGMEQGMDQPERAAWPAMCLYRQRDSVQRDEGRA